MNAQYKTISHREAEAYYDSWGSKQDTQSYYESPVFEIIYRLGLFEESENLFEFGCGTGLFAQRLFERYPDNNFNYTGIDLSSKMVSLTKDRLENWSNRTQIIQGTIDQKLPFESKQFDRFVSTYVLDILSPKDIATLLKEAHRLLQPKGLLILAGITTGGSFLSKLRMRFWRWRFKQNPLNVGGCRPMNLCEYLPADQWQFLSREVSCHRLVSSEVIFARKDSILLPILHMDVPPLFGCFKRPWLLGWNILKSIAQIFNLLISICWIFS